VAFRLHGPPSSYVRTCRALGLGVGRVASGPFWPTWCVRLPTWRIPAGRVVITVCEPDHHDGSALARPLKRWLCCGPSKPVLKYSRVCLIRFPIPNEVARELVEADGLRDPRSTAQLLR
jgi:hypothetical protein